ncbi:MAG: flagellar hook-associated protein 3 [Gammaproteobacteria bacterium]|nr:flagellar hook-associated protein 3 [Gammaproteobacteria bacterium]
MTISTSLFFSRGVDLMSKSQTDLAKLQEKVASGKELVRPSDGVDLALNISRLKSSIAKLDSYKDSLNAVNDRLRIEESYMTGTSDVLRQIKTLTLQGANASTSLSDKNVIATQIEELINELVNQANGTDVNGNFLFAGTRVATRPYQLDDSGVFRYQGDQVNTSVDFSSTRQTVIGRSGPDVFQSVFTGEMLNVVPGIYDIELTGSVEEGDLFQVSLDGVTYGYTAESGDSAEIVLEAIQTEIEAAIAAGTHESITLSVVDNTMTITADDGHDRRIIGTTVNATDGVESQGLTVTQTQEPDPGRPEKIEFFESLQGLTDLLRVGDQQAVQGKLDELDQMIDQATLGLADIGVEMSTIDAQIAINDDLKLSLQAALSGKEDLDYAAAITKMQAQMLSLEAAQSSFAKISQLTLFDYIR